MRQRIKMMTKEYRKINSCRECGHDHSFRPSLVDTKTSIDVIPLLRGSKIVTGDKGHYKRHVVLKHPWRPDRAYVEKLDIQPKGHSWEMYGS